MLVCRCFNELSHAEEFLSGKIRMMSLRYYRKMEDDNHGRKDKYEGSEKLWQGKNTTLTIDGKKITSQDGLVSVIIRTDSYEKNTKICCCTLLPITNRIEGLDNLRKFHLPYTILFKEPDEFINRFKKAATGKNFATGKVSFFDEKTYNGDLTAFQKPNSFKWQNEFRLLLESPTEDPFYLNIGDIHDIASIYDTDKLIELLARVSNTDINKMIFKK